MVFYDTEGSLEDIANFKIKPVEFYLLDIGTAGYTEFIIDTNILDVYSERPHLIGKQWGYLHSHHSMTTFFSPTDSDNLHESSEFFNYYFSLIVNIAGEYSAKVSRRGNIKSESNIIKSFKNNKGELYEVPQRITKEEECVYVYNCEINWENIDHDTLLKIRSEKAKIITTQNSYNFHGFKQKRSASEILKEHHFNKKHKNVFLEEDDDFSSLAEKKDSLDQLSMFELADEEVEPIPFNYLEEIIEAVVGVNIEDKDFNENLQSLKAITQIWRKEVLEETQEALSLYLQPFYELKKEPLIHEKQLLLKDLENKLMGYNAPPMFYEIIKEAFKEEFNV